ncbi:MAG: aminotransferase class III-fold pyridoxal phosphate-dependent enzyme [Chloroflexota bacterium]
MHNIKEIDKKHVIRGWSVNHATNPLVVEKSAGVYFWDVDGNRYLEFSSALVNLNLGHQHPKVVAAIKAQADKMCYIHPAFATTARVEAAAAIAAITPGDLNQIFFTTSGADANENAIKFARFYTGRHKILAKYRSYHGATMGSISLTGDNRRAPAEPGIPGVVHFPDPFPYHPPRGVSEADLLAHALDHLRYLIEYEGGEHIAALFLESLAGSGGGYHDYPQGYIEGVREICDRHGILLVCDEVMVGFGRTGKWFAVQHTDVIPDMITMAKGLTCGYVPLGAVAVSDRMMEKLGKEKLWAGLTYNGHPLGCATAVAAINVYHEENLVENSAKLGKVMLARMEEIKAKYDIVGDVRGSGLYGCIELVKDRQTKEPIDADLQNKIKPMLMSRGLSTLVKGHIIFTGPPLIINEAQLLEGLDIIESVIADLA